MGRKSREVGGDANLLSFYFYILLALSSQLSVFFEVVYREYPLHFLLRQSCRNLRNKSLGSPHLPLLGLVKSSGDSRNKKAGGGTAGPREK